MKIQFTVMKIGHESDREVKSFSSYEDAENKIKELCESDVLGTVKFYIRKTFSNEK